MTLVFEGVSKVVNGQTHIYKTDLTLQNGTMNVLLGQTSSGKTSLMRLMAGLDVPNTGRVFWNGKDVTGMRVQDRKVAMVYQQFINYPSMSVYDNIASPLRLMGKTKAEIDAAVHKAADLMQLGPMLQRKPLELSGGQQQRIAIARALAAHPPLLLMDEPFGALDEMTREHMQSELLQICAATHTTVVFVTHSIPEAVYLSDRVVVMSAGPGRITDTIDVELGGTRDEGTRENDAFYGKITEVREALRGSEMTGEARGIEDR